LDVAAGDEAAGDEGPGDAPTTDALGEPPDPPPDPQYSSLHRFTRREYLQTVCLACLAFGRDELPEEELPTGGSDGFTTNAHSRLGDLDAAEGLSEALARDPVDDCS
jgi:hypothetical protein